MKICCFLVETRSYVCTWTMIWSTTILFVMWWVCFAVTGARTQADGQGSSPSTQRSQMHFLEPRCASCMERPHSCKHCMTLGQMVTASFWGMVWQLSWMLMTLLLLRTMNTPMLPLSSSSPMPWPQEQVLPSKLNSSRMQTPPMVLKVAMLKRRICCGYYSRICLDQSQLAAESVCFSKIGVQLAAGFVWFSKISAQLAAESVCFSKLVES